MVSASVGVKAGTTTLLATLSNGSGPLAGKAVRIQVRGRNVGKAITNAQGVATLNNVKLKGLKAGVYGSGITASFAGNASLKPRTSRGSLTVSNFATSLTPFLPVASTAAALASRRP